tara:strand:- start:184 stop:855 length:672 start_codon:yes stop_codon:yes gene_type:complete
MKIFCITQRPTQTNTLIYLLGKKNIKLDLIISTNIQKKNYFYQEKKNSYISLKEQCKMSNIKYFHIPNPNSKKIPKILKKYKVEAGISLVTDTILSEDILKSLKNGLFGIHNGILPKYRGIDANGWAILAGEKKIGFCILKLSSGIDDGKIYKQIKFSTKKFKRYNEVGKYIYYNYKLYEFGSLLEKLKKNLKIDLKMQKGPSKMYYKLKKHEINKVNKILSF